MRTSSSCPLPAEGDEGDSAAYRTHLLASGQNAEHVTTHRDGRSSNPTQDSLVPRQCAERLAIVAGQPRVVGVAADYHYDVPPCPGKIRDARSRRKQRNRPLFRERRFIPDISPSNMREWFWSSNSLMLWGCENMVNRGQFSGDNDADLLLPNE